ncbi:MAG TPA: PA14 domain-containing protein [Acidimicrobiales bacterium]|nr:PA14 domain-containing protein [Acidimicrobiales bacterium]
MLATALIGAMFSALPVPSAAASPKLAADLPGLESPTPKRPDLSIPRGDFSRPPSAEDGISPLPADAIALAGLDTTGKAVIARTANTTTYANPDGTNTLVVRGGMVNFQDAGGTWRQIDPRLHADGAGDLVNGAGPVAARFRHTPTAAELLSLSGSGWSLTSGLVGLPAGLAATGVGATAHYGEVLPGVQLDEQMGTDRLKETLRLDQPPAVPLPGTLRFPLRLNGLSPRTEADGAITFDDATGTTKLRIPVGLATDSSQVIDAHGLTPRAPVVPKLVQIGPAWEVDLQLPSQWLTDPARVYPVFIDPTYTFNAGPRDTSGYDENVGSGCGNCYYDGATSVEANAYVDRVGYETFNGGNWQFFSYLHFDVSQVLHHSVNSAFFNGHVYQGGFVRTYPVAGDWTIGMDMDHRVGHRTDSADMAPASNTDFSLNITSWAQNWASGAWGPYGLTMDTAGNPNYVQVAAMEEAFAGQDPYIAISFNDTPASVPANAQLSPADGTVTTNPTPTLTSAAMTDAEGDPVSYWFRLATGPDAESGQVINSGWFNPGAGVAPSFQVPAGAMQDGATYSWKVFTWDGYGPPGYPRGTPYWSSWPPMKVKVNLRLGDSASPNDAYGPVSTNLATGNLHYGYNSPSIASVGGPIGVGFDYNSRAQSSFGLTGTYWDNCTTPPSSMPPPGAQEKVVRRDTQVNFSWATPPVPFMAATGYCAEWTGYLTLPYQANYWSLGASSDDGVRITLTGVKCNDGTTNVLDRWADGSTAPVDAFNGSCTFSTIGPNQTVPIRVDYYNNQGPGSIDLYVAGPVGGELPVDWLSPSISTVPQGWSVSGGASAAGGYTNARVGDNSLVLTDRDGTPHEYQRTGSGATTMWKPVDDGDSFVSQDAAGNIVVHAEDGVIYTFNPKGNLTSAVAATDDTHPAAPSYGYDPNSGRLTTITDPVSGRVSTLTYQADPDGTGADPNCPTKTGFLRAPAGMLCTVRYGDANATRTNLYYNTNGQLARIEEWASNTNTNTSITDFTYGTSGQLVTVRDPLAADVVASGGRADDQTHTTARTLIAYDGAGRAQSVTLPAPSAATDARPTHTYTYISASETRVAAAGITPTVGWFRRVLYDPRGRVTDDFDAAGLDTKTTWDNQDGVTSKTEPSLLETATIYDGGHPAGGAPPRHLPTDTYGPAPASCFNAPDANGAVTPNGTCTNPPVPHAVTNYDEGISGLAAAYYAGPETNGPVVFHDTSLHTGNIHKVWASSSPGGGLSLGNWALRLTGEFNAPGGTTNLDTKVAGGIRIWVDDNLVADRWAVTIDLVERINTVSLGAGWHRIRVDFRPYDASNATISVDNKVNNVDIPWFDGSFSPRYGLATSKVDPDGKKTATQFADAAHGIGPEFGLPTATVDDPDAGGLALTTATTYEAPGASTYLRRLSKTMPKGAATTYAYYAAGDSAPSNDCGGGVAAGMLKQSADPAPATGSAIVHQYVYDGLNRVVGARVVSGNTADTFWSCTNYDGRGRTSSQRDSKGVTTTYSYSTPAQVTTSYTDSGGTPRTTVRKVSLTGQQISYTDELGTITRVAYDQLDRARDSYRTFSGSAEGHLMNWAYDTGTARLASVSDYSASQASPRTTALSYDSAGRLTTTARPNGVTTTTSFEPNVGTVASLSNKLGATELSPWAYTYTAGQRVATEQATVSGQSRTRTFAYDGAGRLTRTAETLGGTNSTRNYSFDADSNRCSTTTTCDGSYSYDGADRLLASPFATSYAYDNHGNLVTASPLTSQPDGAISDSWAFDAVTGTPHTTSYTFNKAGTFSERVTSDAMPSYASNTASGAVAPAGVSSTAVAVRGPSFVKASLTWTQGAGGYAPVTLRLKDATGAVVKSAAGAGGSVNLSYLTPNVTATWSLEVADTSSSVAVPSFSLPWSITAETPATYSGSLNPGTNVVTAGTALGPGYVTGGFSYAPGTAQRSSSPTGTVAGGSTFSQPVSISAAGPVTASLDWPGLPVYTPGNAAPTVGAGGSWSAPMTAAGRSYVHAAASWNQATHSVPSTVTGTASLSDMQLLNVTAQGTISVSTDWSPTTASLFQTDQPASPTQAWTRALTISANGNVSPSITWTNGTVPSVLELALLDPSGNVVATSNTQPGANSATISPYFVAAGYAAKKTYTLRVTDTGAAVSFNVSGSYPVTPNATVELWDPVGATKLASNYASTTKPKSLSYAMPAGAPTGNYRLKVISTDYPARYTATASLPRSDYANVQMVLKRSDGTVAATAPPGAGSLELAYLTPGVTPVDAYSLEVDDVSTDLPASALSVTWSTNTESSQAPPASVAATSLASLPLAVADQGYVDAPITWQGDTHQVSASQSGSVTPRGNTTQLFNVTGQGTISCTVDWNPTTASLAQTGQPASPTQAWTSDVTVSANGTIAPTIAWTNGAVPSVLELSLQDSSGNVVATSNTQPGATSATLAPYPVTASYTAKKTYTLRVTDTGPGVSFDLSGSFPATATVRLELWNPANTTMLASTSTGAKPKSLSYTMPVGAPTGNYRLKVISSNYAATFTSNANLPTLDFANVTLRLKDSTGAVLKSVSGANGSAELAAPVASAGNYTLEIQNTSADLDAVAMSGVVAAPGVHSADLDLELYDPSGARVAQAANNPTAKPEVLAYTVPAAGPLGTYSLKVISHDYDASWHLSESHWESGYATLVGHIDDHDGNVLASATSNNGSLSVDYFTATVAGGAADYSFNVTNTSSDFPVPSYTGSFAVPDLRYGDLTLQLKDGAGQVVTSASGYQSVAVQWQVSAGQYTLVATPTGGMGTATATGSYPRASQEALTYDGSDHATSIDDGTVKVSETLAPSGRVIERRVVIDATGVVSEDTLFGYDGDNDSPAYSMPASGSGVTTYVSGPQGLLLTDTAGMASWAITNAHGDVAGTTDANGAFTASPPTDEFGVGVEPASRLGWLGGKERFGSGTTLGFVRMGVRLYDPNLGRFLEVDPVEGGSANAYDYAEADPVNCADLNGTAAHHGLPADDDIGGLSCRKLQEYIAKAIANLKSRDRDFRQNRRGYDYNDKGYRDHVTLYRSIQRKLRLLLDEYNDRCGAVSTKAFRAAYGDPARLGHPGQSYMFGGPSIPFLPEIRIIEFV